MGMLGSDVAGIGERLWRVFSGHSRRIFILPAIAGVAIDENLWFTGLR
jgi:hypothetical protein